MCPVSLFMVQTNKIKLLFSKACVNGNTENDCETCEPSYHRSISSGKCICGDKFYDDGSNELCGTCHYSWFS